MVVSYEWLQDYIKEDLPEPGELARVLTKHAYEVEGVEERDGDHLIDIDILPNRAGDSLSHVGIAREIATLCDLTFAFPSYEVDTAAFKSAREVELVIDPSVRRATKRVARNITVGETPDFIQDRLHRLGQRSINNVVDITNYVMLELGQPVHAFDLDKIEGGEKKQVTVRFADDGEQIKTLDGDTHELDSSMLVIADENQALDIAGIKGGANSSIDETTTRALLSVCNFPPGSIRATSQKLSLRTDASKRFENDISPELARIAMDRLSRLLVEHAGAEVSEDIVDVYPHKASSYTVGVTREEVNSLLGSSMSEEDIETILSRLHFEYEKITSSGEKIAKEAEEFVGTPYRYGASVSMDAPEYFDCSSLTSYLCVREGIALPRVSIDQLVYGASIEETDLTEGDLVFAKTGEGKLHTTTVDYLKGREVAGGVDHVGIYVGDGYVVHASRYNGDGGGEIAKEKIKESEQFQHVVGYRRIPGLGEKRFKVTVPDYRRDIRRSADLVEEIGRVYGYDNIPEDNERRVSREPTINNEYHYENVIRDTLKNKGFSEVMTYSFGEVGEIELKNPLAEDKRKLRSTLAPGMKDALERNMKNKELLGVDSVHLFEIGTVFEKDRELRVLGICSEDKDALARMCEEIEHVLKDLTIRVEEDGYKEIDLTVINNLPTPEESRTFDAVESRTFTPISPYPYVLRDIALWVPRDISSEEVEDLIRKEAGDLLVRIKLFDVYEKEDRISYAFRLVFQSDKKTLEDAEVNDVMEKVTAMLEAKKYEVR